MNRLIVLAAMLGAAATVPAEAQTREDRTVHIAYQPSELLSAEGRARLQRRVVTASQRVCRIDSGRSSLLLSADELNCRKAALADARQAADRAILAANQGVLMASRTR